MGLSGVSSAPTNLDVSYADAQYVLNGKPASQDEVNAALGNHGLTAKAGLYTTSDGFVVGDGGVSTNYGGPTPLPDLTGGFSDNSTVQGKLAWGDGMSDGALMWAAFSEMARSSIRDTKDAREIKNAMHRGKMEAKTAQINATEKQIEAEREAAAQAFAVAVVAAVATALIGFYSQGLGTAVGQVLTAGQQYMSKESGPQRQADEQKLVAKRYELQEALMDDNIDSAKSNYEEAREQFKLAMRILTESFERQTQVVQKITS